MATSKKLPKVEELSGYLFMSIQGTNVNIVYHDDTDNGLAIGAALGIAVLLGGPISGGAFNPAVTIALNYSGKLDKNDIIPYIIAQIAGALIGFQLYKNLIYGKESLCTLC
mgnify:CR=1 FL=1